MANQEHLDILKQGVEVWNKWREEHLEVEPDLSEADLSGYDFIIGGLRREDLLGGRDWGQIYANHSKCDFSGVDFRETNFTGSYFYSVDFSSSLLHNSNFARADLEGVDFADSNLQGAFFEWTQLHQVDFTLAELQGAKLSDSHLIGVCFDKAKLSGATLEESILYDISFVDADLQNAILRFSNLIDVDFQGADLKGAVVGLSSFCNIDLRNVKGLDAMIHEGRSTVGTDTLERSQGDISEKFLRGVGLSDTLIEYAHSLVNKPIDYYTCFISYSSKDQEFAERLHTDLQDKGVRCWFAPEDLKIGDKFWRKIDESIRLYDKLLVVLSKHSVASTWVENEVMAALEKEQKHPDKPVLFPIKLDETVMKTDLPWAANMRRTRHIGDFTKWKRYEHYQKALDRLLRDLKAGE